LLLKRQVENFQLSHQNLWRYVGTVINGPTKYLF